MLEFSAFHNWCDRCCESCPLHLACPLPEETGSLEEILERLRGMLEKLCVEQGISPDHVTPPPPPAIDELLLRRAAIDYAAALREAGISAAGVLLVGKVARVASYLGEEEESWVWQADAVPNLLLIERLLADLAAEVERRGARMPQRVVERVAMSERRLRCLLAPLFETIPSVARSVLSTMIAAGCAPSPFVKSTFSGKTPTA